MSDDKPTEIDIKAGETLPGDVFYMVTKRSVVAWRDGKAVALTGTEAEKVRRWVLREKR